MWYRVKTGMFAWILFRVTGIALVVYLAMHLTVISNLHNPGKFNETMAFLGSWQFRLLEIGLLAVIIYHALNGVRILFVDFGKGSLYQAKLFWILAVIGLVLFIVGAYPIFNHAMYWKDKGVGQTTHTLIKQSTPARILPLGEEGGD